MQAHIKQAITAGDMRPLPASVSAEACEFVAAMLEPDRCARPTAADLLQHPFLARSACGSPRRCGRQHCMRLRAFCRAAGHLHVSCTPEGCAPCCHLNSCKLAASTCLPALLISAQMC